MKLFIKIFLLSIVFSTSSLANVEVKPSRTYHVQITGDNQLKEAILQKLTAKPCFKLDDLQRGSTGPECYAFVPKSNGVKLESANDYLLKVKIKSAPKSNRAGVISVQGFKLKGEVISRYFNAGNFSIPSQHQIKTGTADFSESVFVKQASDTIIGLAFK